LHPQAKQDQKNNPARGILKKNMRAAMPAETGMPAIISSVHAKMVQ